MSISPLLAERLERFSASTLYPVVTSKYCAGRSVPEVMLAIAKGGARVVQLREKHLSERELLPLAKECRKITSDYGMLLIIDDSLAVALACDADGVHLGQEDFPIADARRIAPDLLLGCSTHNPEEIAAAQRDGTGYLNIGPIFATQTKEVSYPTVGLENLDRYRKAVQCPFSVMGGIKEHHLPILREMGIRHIAMVTEITMAPDITAHVQKLCALL